MTIEHTPTPWTLGQGSKTAKDHAICDGPRIIAKVIGGGYPAGIGASPQSIADAEFIVQACNAHDDLVAALQSLFDVADSHNADAWNWESEKAMTQARAALAKAKGE